MSRYKPRGLSVVNAEYVKAEVDRAVDQLGQCRELLGKAPAELPTKAISLASGAVKAAQTLLATIRDVIPKGPANE